MVTTDPGTGAGALAGRSAPVYDPVLRSAAHSLVGRWLLDKLGLGSIIYASVGGASVSPELLKFFWSLGVPTYETYGQSETSGVAFSQKELERPRDRRVDHAVPGGAHHRRR